MKAPRFANSVSQLCDAVPMSRTWYYELRRMPGAPVPCSNGRFSIAAWRKFSKKKQATAKPSEKDDLELRCLRLKAETLEHDLNERREKTRKEILDDLIPQFEAAGQSIRAGLYRMKNQLCPSFEGKSAREMFRAWTDYEGRLFEDVCRELSKRTGAPIDEKATRPAVNVVPFNQRKATVR